MNNNYNEESQIQKLQNQENTFSKFNNANVAKNKEKSTIRKIFTLGGRNDNAPEPQEIVKILSEIKNDKEVNKN